MGNSQETERSRGLCFIMKIVAIKYYYSTNVKAQQQSEGILLIIMHYVSTNLEIEPTFALESIQKPFRR